MRISLTSVRRGIVSPMLVVMAPGCAELPGTEAENPSHAGSPIIDVHNHAQSPSAWGSPPVMACAGEVVFPAPERGALPSPDRVGIPQHGYNLESAEECCR